jgi:leucyl aminopeptidase
MKLFYRQLQIFILVLISNVSNAHVLLGTETVPVFADLHLLKAIKVPILVQDPQINLGFAYLTPLAQLQLSLLAHQYGKCGGFEVVQDIPNGDITKVVQSIQSLKQKLRRDQLFANGPIRPLVLPVRPEITQALAIAEEKNLMTWVNWLTAFPNRYNKDANPNNHVVQLKVELEKMLSRSRQIGRVDLIDHKSTKQKTVRLILEGAVRPQESVIIGGHLDSITFSGKVAPGADDNASGSANIIEAVRVILSQPRPARTLEFMWYAGEESGLLGSAEIASAYKSEKRNVIGVLQLDMTLFPGSGEFVIANMTDFTSAWLRDLLKEINDNYLKVKLVEDSCGYGCSDHASWYRQGFPTLSPFESTMRTMNKNIHTAKDIVTPVMSYKHSLVFTKIAIAMAMELGNNLQLRSPY